MPAALVHVFDSFDVASVRLPRPRTLFAVGAGLIAVAAVWGVANASDANPRTQVTPLYPAVPASVSVIDMSRYTTEQTLNQVPELSRYALLAYNGGVEGNFEGAGSYALYAPASNYLDYLPRGALAHLTRAQMGELAMAQVGAQPQGARIFREYKTKNGIIFVTDKVNIPTDLKSALTP